MLFYAALGIHLFILCLSFCLSNTHIQTFPSFLPLPPRHLLKNKTFTQKDQSSLREERTGETMRTFGESRIYLERMNNCATVCCFFGFLFLFFFSCYFFFFFLNKNNWLFSFEI